MGDVALDQKTWCLYTNKNWKKKKNPVQKQAKLTNKK